MCKVKDIEECAKRVCVHTMKGETFASEWFFDDERKNTYGADIFTRLEKEHYERVLKENNLTEKDVKKWSVNREKASEKDCVFISRHAFDRMRERNGWNKKTAMRMTKKIYDNGLDPDEVKGEYRPWARYRAQTHPDCMLKFYGQSLYVFQNNILITVLQGTKLYRQQVA